MDFSLGQGADGGVDLVLRKAGRVSLVQCKQWKVFSVGAPVIREMFGIMTAERADEAIIVTSGGFTSEAERFAQGKPIRLLDGPRLLKLVKQVQNRGHESSAPSPTTAEPDMPPFCPVCGKVMVLRTARRGQNAGNQFLGCPDYPDAKACGRSNSWPEKFQDASSFKSECRDPGFERAFAFQKWRAPS